MLQRLFCGLAFGLDAGLLECGYQEAPALLHSSSVTPPQSMHPASPGTEQEAQGEVSVAGKHASPFNPAVRVPTTSCSRTVQTSRWCDATCRVYRARQRKHNVLHSEAINYTSQRLPPQLLLLLLIAAAAH